ncbi:MAG TPA: MarR family transcriptional regulator [Thermoplasmata archaeon]|nr:MarR family transcriptional regulator [Thermoplasmata archaeon]
MAPPPPPEEASEPVGRLDDRVLLALEERNGRIPFSGLRRSLGAHPESLSRALRRLEREGLVERSSEGYRSVRQPERVAGAGSELHSVARIELPGGIDPGAVLERLTGRWFGTLRWMGVVDRPHGRLLSWARRDGSGSVLLGIRRDTVQIFTSGEADLDDAADSEDAAYELLVAVADTLRPHAVRSSVTFLARESVRHRGGRPLAPGPMGGWANN